jgi:pyruvate/2-oxoglutarate dehydrogenase complex dihydrolipoamide acyltransferase (E2) component
MTGYFKRKKDVSAFHAFAAHMWSQPNNPIILGAVKIDMSNALEYIKKYSARHGVKVTITHLVIAAAARYLKTHPEVNSKCHARRFYQRKSIDIFNLVDIKGGRDLSGVILRDCDQMSLSEIAMTIRKRATEVKSGTKDIYGDGMNMFKGYPTWFTRVLLKLADFYINTLNGDLTKFGIPRDPFGSLIVSSVGMFGIEEAYAPLPTFARAPIFLVAPKVVDTPWVVDNKMQIRPVMKIGATIDHRVIDGYKGAQLADCLRQFLTNPEDAFGLSEKIPVGHGIDSSIKKYDLIA